MIHGVRKPDEAARLGLGNRLMIRIGALLKKDLAISPVLLEAARPGSPLEAALLAPRVLESAASLTSENLPGTIPPSSGLPALALIEAEDKVRVLCLQEELEAGEWSIPATPIPQGQELALPTQPAQFPGTDGGPGIFAPKELERLRLKLLTAGNPAERIEALRVLSMAPGASGEKLEILLQGLNDRDAPVRAEAAGLLTLTGVGRDISEALAALNQADTARRDAALDRLARLINPNTREIDIGAIAVSTLAALRNDAGGPQTSRLMDLLRSCAPQLAGQDVHVAEVLRIVLGLVDAAARRGASPRELEQAITPAYKLIAALGNYAPERLLPLLHVELERSGNPVSTGLLLQLLLDLTPLNAGSEAAVIELAAAFLARDTEEGRDSRAIGSRLLRRGERAMLAVCEKFPAATPAAQKYFMLLMDDLWRTQGLPATLLQRGAELVLRTLQAGSKPLTMAAAQARFITDPRIDDETRGKLAECIMNSASDFIFAFDIERVEQTLTQLGAPALDVLLERLSPQRPRNERVRAVRLLGNAALELKAPQGQLARVQQGITEAVRRAQLLVLEPDFPDRGELFCALGKLAACPAASREAGSIIERTLLEAARGSDPKLGARALEGLAHLAASRRARPELISEASILLRKLLDGSSFDIGTAERRINGENVIEISGGETYTTILPLALQGLARIACSHNCPPAITREILSLLIAFWRRVCSAEVVWGPANTALLIQALKEIGASRALSAEMRADLLKALAPKLMQTAVMHAVTEMLAADDTAFSAGNALAIGVALFSRRGADAQFHMDDRPEILRALARIAGRKHLGAGSGDGPGRARNFRRMAVDEIFKGLRDGINGCYESLLMLRGAGNLPSDLKEEIERRMRDLHAVIRS